MTCNGFCNVSLMTCSITIKASYEFKPDVAEVYLRVECAIF